MPARTVITFLGRQLSKDGVPQYREARYRFDDGQVYETRSFVGALMRWLPGQDRPVGRLIVVGTPTSMWAALAEVFEPDEEALEILARVERASAGEGAAEADLEALGRSMEASLAIPVSVLPIGECSTLEEQLALVAAFAERVGAGDRIVVDITHSFRHLPLLGVAAAHFLRHGRGCALESAYYGMVEGRAPGEDAPVIDLAGLLRILEVGEALGAHAATGSLEPVARAVGDLLPGLAEAAFRVDTFQIGQARRHARVALQALDATPSPLLRVAAPDLRSALEWTTRDALLHHRQWELARRAHRSGQTAVAALMLMEAVVTHACREVGAAGDDYDEKLEAVRVWRKGLSKDDRDRFDDLRDLRNALAHGGLGGRWATRQALQDRRCFSKHLDELIAWAGKRIGAGEGSGAG